MIRKFDSSKWIFHQKVDSVNSFFFHFVAVKSSIFRLISGRVIFQWRNYLESNNISMTKITLKLVLYIKDMTTSKRKQNISTKSPRCSILNSFLFDTLKINGIVNGV